MLGPMRNDQKNEVRCYRASYIYRRDQAEASSGGGGSGKIVASKFPNVPNTSYVAPHSEYVMPVVSYEVPGSVARTIPGTESTARNIGYRIPVKYSSSPVLHKKNPCQVCMYIQYQAPNPR